MDYWILNLLAVFGLCVLLAGFLIPQILLIAFRRKLFDEVDPRKIHKGAVPRLGGLAFVPVIFLSIALVMGANSWLGNWQMGMAFKEQALMLINVFCCLQLLYLVGIADDLVGVRYNAKFAVQMVCSVLLIIAGVWYSNFGGIFGIWGLPAWLGMPFTFVVIVFLINAINLIDGIDGLASGLSSIACLIYGVAFYYLDDMVLALLSFATLGVLLPFFYYNVFGNAERHSKIFMGDTGSLTVGLVLCVLGIKLFTTSDTTHLHWSPVVLAFSPLIIPCFDVVRVYLRRLRNHRNPFTPDKTHIHHKLLAAGMNQRMAMITIVTCSAVLTALNLWLSTLMNINIVIAIDIAIWLFANERLTAAITARERQDAAK